MVFIKLTSLSTKHDKYINIAKIVSVGKAASLPTRPIPGDRTEVHAEGATFLVAESIEEVLSKLNNAAKEA